MYDDRYSPTERRRGRRGERYELTTMKEQSYEVAEYKAFYDTLQTGLTDEVIAHTLHLASNAMEGINRFPDFREVFVDEVREYAYHAMSIVKGGYWYE